MKIEFVASLAEKYMVIEEQSDYEEDYRYHILLSHHIPGLLPCSLRRMDQSLRFYYEIREQICFDEQLQSKGITEDMVRSLVLSVWRMENDCRAFLLDPCNVVLQMKLIYFENGRFFFCYLPTYRKNPKEALHELLGELLERVDRHEWSLVDMLHTLYRKTEGEYLIQEIAEEINAREQDEANDIPGETIWETEQNSSYEKERGFWKRCKGIRFLKRGGKNGERKNKSAAPGYDESNPYDLEEWEEDPATTYLYQEDRPHRIAFSSPNGDHYFVVDESPYYIGSDVTESVKGYIASPVISKKHARIRSMAGCYFLEDLYSTNGTYYNGHRLEPGERVQLSPGDRVLFANREYVVHATRPEVQ